MTKRRAGNSVKLISDIIEIAKIKKNKKTKKKQSFFQLQRALKKILIQ